MSNVSSSSVKTCFSHLPETAYGTKRAANAVYVRVDELNRFFLDAKPVYEKDTINNGGDENADQFKTIWNFDTPTIETYLEFKKIGYWLHMIMGGYSSSGSSAPYAHAFTPQNKNTSRQLPTRTFAQSEGSNLFVFPSVGLSELTIEKSEDGRLKVMATPHGQGAKLLNPASYAMAAETTGAVFAMSNKATHTFTDTVESESGAFGCSLDSWKWIFSNSQYGTGFRDCSVNYTSADDQSGMIKSEHLTSEFNWSAELVVRYDTGNVIAETAFQNNNLLQIESVITSTALAGGSTPYSLTLLCSKAKISDVSKSMEDKGFTKRTIKVDFFAVNGQLPITATLVNATASYIA
jgi:hypothetical protein